ncbi:hypothetical protein, partial [Chitiniphilus shinanonensis]|uniref:hypothetical protein n=1 Tax=Chitiniphilus shinanonensis TaxID=553088 RepID=UPI0033423BE9
GLAGGINTYGYVGGSPLAFQDRFGLEPWDWNGVGNTSVCEYYALVANLYPRCPYYKEAYEICRGGNKIVNGAVNVAIFSAWLFGSTDASQAKILEDVRAALVSADWKAREDGKIDCNNDCVYGNDIDKYHDDAFRNAGLSPVFYGGNIWPQGVYPNPVPRDPRNPLPPMRPNLPFSEPIPMD